MNNSKKNTLQVISFFFFREIKRIFKDPGALLIMLIAVVIYPIIYSVSYSTQVLRDLEIAVVDLDHSLSSTELEEMIDATQELKIAVKVNNLKEAEKLFYEDKVHGVILIPRGFEEDIYKGTTPVLSVYSDASYFLKYKQTLIGTLKSIETLNAKVEIKKRLVNGEDFNQAIKNQNPLNVNYQMLFNPSSGYGTFIMPGFILVIMQQTLLIGIGLLGGTRKEKIIQGESPSPILLYQNQRYISQLIIGKSLAYLILYLFNAFFGLYWISHWFNFPVRGRVLDILMLIVPYFLSISFLGLTVSALLKKRENAILLMVFLSPIILFLSGLSWPKEAIPDWLNIFAYIFPSTFMVPAYMRLQVMGTEIFTVKNELIIMMVQMIIYFFTAIIVRRLIYRKNADSKLKNP